MLTETGLQVEKLVDLIPETISQLQQDIDPSIGITDSDPIYQILVIFLSQVDRLWQLGQAVSDSQNLDKAEGKFLDDLGAIVGGIRRNAATPTSGTQYFRGQVGTNISAGTLLENTQNKDRYVVSQNVNLSSGEVYEATLVVATIEASTNYTITVDSTNYTITSSATPTASEILSALGSQMDLDVEKDFSYSIVSSKMILVPLGAQSISISATSNLNVESVVNSGLIQALEEGPKVGNANTVTKIVTPVAGLLSTYNPSQLAIGRTRESDEDYRLRIASSRVISGKATVPAIEANLRNVPGVLYASVIENDTDAVDSEGRPRKSIEAIVDGGTDDAVGTVLWSTKAAGMQTVGNTFITIVDTDNQPQTVYFSRPVPLYIAVRITYTKYDEEIFPDDTGEDYMRQAVVDYVASLGLSKDLFPGKFFKAIYDSVEGLGTIVVELQTLSNADDPPVELNWSTAPIPVPTASFAQVIGPSVYIDEEI